MKPNWTHSKQSRPWTRVEFLAFANRETWDKLIGFGYGGSDGVTSGPDMLGRGCRIGRTTTVWEWLAALIHDELYTVGRLFRLDPIYQQWADEYYLEIMLATADATFTRWWEQPERYIARGLANTQYGVLRIAGSRAFTAASFLIPGGKAMVAMKSKWVGNWDAVELGVKGTQ